MTTFLKYDNKLRNLLLYLLLEFSVDFLGEKSIAIACDIKQMFHEFWVMVIHQHILVKNTCAYLYQI